MESLEDVLGAISDEEYLPPPTTDPDGFRIQRGGFEHLTYDEYCEIPKSDNTQLQMAHMWSYMLTSGRGPINLYVINQETLDGTPRDKLSSDEDLFMVTTTLHKINTGAFGQLSSSVEQAMSSVTKELVARIGRAEDDDEKEKLQSAMASVVNKKKDLARLNGEKVRESVSAYTATLLAGNPEFQVFDNDLDSHEGYLGIDPSHVLNLDSAKEDTSLSELVVRVGPGKGERRYVNLSREDIKVFDLQPDDELDQLLDALWLTIADGSEEKVDVLWQMHGRALHGVTNPLKFFFIRGTAGSGKSFQGEMAQRAIGNQYAVSDFDLSILFNKKELNATAHRIKKSRVATANEIDHDTGMVSSTLKKLGQSSESRDLYSTSEEVGSGMTLLVIMNDLVQVPKDSGIERRLIGLDLNAPRAKVEAAFRDIERYLSLPPGEWKSHPRVIFHYLTNAVKGWARLRDGHTFDRDHPDFPAWLQVSSEQFLEDRSSVEGALLELFDFTGDSKDKVSARFVLDSVARFLGTSDIDPKKDKKLAGEIYRAITAAGGSNKKTVRPSSDPSKPCEGFTGIRPKTGEGGVRVVGGTDYGDLRSKIDLLVELGHRRRDAIKMIVHLENEKNRSSQIDLDDALKHLK